MQKQIRRALMLLVAILLTASIPLSAAAQSESSDRGMETALIAVKTLIEIDDSVFKDFNYSSSFSNYETKEGLIWSFSWSSDDGYIFTRVRDDGTVMSYWKYSYQYNSFGFAEIGKDRAIEIADEFISRAKPDAYAFYKSPDDVSINLHDSDYRLSYFAFVNGIEFDAASISINVNKFSGEITGYSTTNIDRRYYSYDETSGIIDEGTAISAYAEKIGLSLEYRSSYNYEDGAIAIFPVYLFNSHGDRYIGAKTGDVVEYVYDLGVDDVYNEYGSDGSYDMAMAESTASGGSASLTPAEIEAIDRVGNYMSPEQAVDRLLEVMDLVDLDTDAFGERYISLNNDYNNRDRYVYEIFMYNDNAWREMDNYDEVRYFAGRVDAESGRVTQFQIEYVGFDEPDGSGYSEEQAGAAILSFLEGIAPTESSKTKLEESWNSSVYAYNYRGELTQSFIRYENGIPFRNNRISVSFDMNRGRVTRYNLNWNDNAVFPDIDDVLSQEEALSAFVAQNGSNIKYITVGDGNVGLVYEFLWSSYIDPFSGIAIDYNGDPWESFSITPNYSDVEGHWSENVVMKLLENGVFLWGGLFEPDKVMTEQEFLQYLLLIEHYYYPVAPAAYFLGYGIEIEADPNKELTRQEATRIVVQYLGYGKLAEQPEWFIYPFSDDVVDEYKGYVTICYMLGIIGGNNGVFNAASNITRAEAAVILQNVILLKSS